MAMQIQVQNKFLGGDYDQGTTNRDSTNVSTPTDPNKEFSAFVRLAVRTFVRPGANRYVAIYLLKHRYVGHHDDAGFIGMLFPKQWLRLCRLWLVGPDYAGTGGLYAGKGLGQTRIPLAFRAL